jgi:hypothetical protein
MVELLRRGLESNWAPSNPVIRSWDSRIFMSLPKLFGFNFVNEIVGPFVGDAYELQQLFQFFI